MRLAERIESLTGYLASRKRRLRMSSEKSFATGNHAAGFAKLVRLAKYGDADSCYRLALAYEQGRGTAHNLGQAVHWYECAARQGMAAAMARLGDICLMAIKGTNAVASSAAEAPLAPPSAIDRPTAELSIQKAIFWYREAAAMGFAEAQSRLAFQHVAGMGVPCDLRIARHLFEMSAAQGHAEGQLGLGLLLAAGADRENAKDRAVQLLRSAARQGSPKAKFALARLLAQDELAQENGDEAAGLLLELATGNNTEAMYELGELYRAENRKLRDLGLAEIWLRRACTRGHLRAFTSLDHLLTTQLSPPRAGDAAAILRQGAELDDPRCQIRIAEIYLSGQGTPVDANAAAYWLNKAGGHGYVSARAYWEKAPQGYEKGRRWLQKPRLVFFDYAIETVSSGNRNN
jgi:TPR repeat protein